MQAPPPLTFGDFGGAHLSRPAVFGVAQIHVKQKGWTGAHDKGIRAPTPPDMRSPSPDFE